jgi:carbohydrate-selective porin OprB
MTGLRVFPYGLDGSRRTANSSFPTTALFSPTAALPGTNGARKTLELEGSRGVGAEMVLEFTYKAILTPWLYVQPDAQFIINPGATQDLSNAFVIGGRVSINF